VSELFWRAGFVFEQAGIHRNEQPEEVVTSKKGVGDHSNS
jgi:hypothetical protein